MSGAADITVAEIDKNTREKLRVSVGSFRGHELVHIRLWCPNKDGTELIPTKAGVSIRQAILPDLIAALQKAVNAPAMMAEATSDEQEAADVR
jgi:hypothetical protein